MSELKNSEKCWLPEQDEVILREWPDQDRISSEIGRSKFDIRARASVLGITRMSTRWTDAEDNILKEYYSVEGDQVFRRLHNQTRSSCDYRARGYGLTPPKSRCITRWTDNEDQILQENYPIYCPHIPQLLSNRSVEAIDRRARGKGLKWLKPVFIQENAVNVVQKADGLECPKCGKMIILRLAESLTFFCPNCGSVLRCQQEDSAG